MIDGNRVLTIDVRYGNGYSDLPTTSGVYGLMDPITGFVRYVGSSVGIERRLYGHNRSHSSALVNPREMWIRNLRKAGWDVEAVVLQEVIADDLSDYKIRHELESKWIAEFRRVGQADLNVALVNVTQYRVREMLNEALGRVEYLENVLRENEISFD